MPDAPNPADAAEGLKPEVKEGPLGLPYIKPEAAPDLPGTDQASNVLPDLGSK